MKVSNADLCEWCLKSKAFLNRQNRDIQVRFKPFGSGNIIKIAKSEVYIRINELPASDSVRLMATNHFKARFDKIIHPKDIERLRSQYIREKKIEAQQRQEAREKLQEACKRREERFHPLRDLVDLGQQILSNKMNVEVPAPKIEEEDIRLALRWCQSAILRQKGEAEKIDSISLQEEYAEHWELAGMLSARAAEKAAIEFYRKHSRQVEDVAITQIRQNNNGDWMDYDLKVNNLPVDVKNSRESKSSKNYVEHCVPKFKENRCKQGVTIAGMLSKALQSHLIINPQQAPGNEDTSLFFLGTTDIDNLTALKKHFEDSCIVEINLTRPGKGEALFLPPWLFDYPDFMYEQRDRAISNIGQIHMPEYELCSEFNFNPIPLFLAAGIGLQQDWNNEALATWEWSFIAEVLHWRQTHRLSLPFLFMTILRHFLGMISNPKAAEDSYHPKEYGKFIYYSCEGIHADKPLFIYDPLRTIDSLINSLITLWSAEHNLIRRFHIFKLQSCNILRARFDGKDKEWKTLIAYCGKCGKNPLILGDAQNCKCGKLICTSCGFCDIRCPLRKENQFAAQAWYM